MIRKKIACMLAVVCIITSTSAMIVNAKIQTKENVRIIQENMVAYSPIGLGGIKETVNSEMKNTTNEVREKTIKNLDKITEVIRKYTNSYKELPIKTDVSKYKEWRIRFNKSVNPHTMNGDTIKLVDSNGKEFNVRLNTCSNPDLADGDIIKSLKDSVKTWQISYPQNGYEFGNTYALIIKKDIKDISKNPSKLEQDVVMKFVISDPLTSTSGTATSTEITEDRDSISTIIKVLKGKRSLDMSCGNNFDKLSELMDSIKGEEYRKAYNVQNYYDYEKSIVDFLNRYKNSKYADITDLDYYKKLPNLTINFDNVNNSNYYDVEDSHSSVGVCYFSKSASDFNNVNSKALTMGAFKIESLGIYKITVDFLRDYKSKNREGVFIWRTDIEKEMLNEINKRRKAKGMNPLTLDNDLIAMAKHSAKLCQLGFSHNMSYTKELLLTDGANRVWARGSVPNPYKNTSAKDSYIGVANFEDNAKRMFGYNKDVKAISETSAIYQNGTDFLNAWEFKKDEFSEEGFSLRDESSRIKSLPCNMTKEKFDMPIKLEENIYNPNMKTIGIGCVHEPPISKQQLNGNAGVFIVTSK